MIEITDILVEEVSDSRGKPTIAVTVHAGGGTGTFSVPSGASTGSSEACELRDPDGHMAQVMKNITEVIRPALMGRDVCDQAGIDRAMLALDGTPSKTKLGGNALIGVSVACAKAAASAQGIETYEHLRHCAVIKPSRTVPFLYSNYINGGKHANSPLAFQEHMIVPNTDSVDTAMSMITTIGTELESRIRQKYGEEAASSMGDEGGYVIPERDPLVPFSLLLESIKAVGFEESVRIATDVAASSFYKEGMYIVGGQPYSAEQLAELFREIVSKYPIISIEDPFFEDSFEDFAGLQKDIGVHVVGEAHVSGNVRIVGDDLTVTNVTRLTKAIESGSIRAIIIKPNQIGTLTEVFDTMKLAREHEIDCIVSHRSGDTMDDFVADLAFAFGAFGLKAGALRKPERRVKYERLAAISSQK